MHHSIEMFRAYEGNKELILFEGTHNSQRPKHIYERVFKLI